MNNLEMTYLNGIVAAKTWADKAALENHPSKEAFARVLADAIAQYQALKAAGKFQ